MKTIPQFASAPMLSPPTAAGIQVLKGPRSNFSLTRISVGFVVTDKVGNEGSTTVIGKKVLQFDDVRVNLEMRDFASMAPSKTVDAIIDLYAAFLSRIPDADGLAYWIQRYNNGLSLDAMADHFYSVGSQFPQLTGYTKEMNHRDFVKQVYSNGLGRKDASAPAAVEIDFWASEIEKGRTRGSVARSMLIAARVYRYDPNWGWVVKLLDNRIKVARIFALAQGLNYLNDKDTIDKTMAIMSLITPDSSVLAERMIPSSELSFNLSDVSDYAALAGMCTPAGQQSWTRAHLDDVYLWYREIVDLPVSPTTSVASYFDSLLVKSKDKFSFTASQASIDGYFQSGTSVTYGYTLLRQGTRLRVVYVQPGSPADKAGLKRGATIAQIDGTSLAQPANDVQYAALYPSKSETHSFDILDPGQSKPRTVNMTAISISSSPVLNAQVLNADGKKYGYMVFNDHIQSAEQPLIDAMNQFKLENVDEMVLDLRYNGGGYLYIADEVAAMIGGRRTAGKIFEQLQYNDKHFSSTNSGTSWFYAYDTKSRPLPTLNLSRVFVLTGNRTCSASESIINSLTPFMDVILIGENTCGKPYGFRQTNNCGTAFFAIQFSGVNALGKGDYVDGFSPQCKVADDLDHALGDTAEARLNAALAYAKTGSCPPTSNVLNGPPPSMSEREPYPWRQIKLVQ